MLTEGTLSETHEHTKNRKSTSKEKVMHQTEIHFKIVRKICYVKKTPQTYPCEKKLPILTYEVKGQGQTDVKLVEI